MNPASKIDGQRRETVARFLWRLDAPVGLSSMFAVAFLIRLLIAPHVGFYGDLRLFQGWAGRLSQVGTHHFYVSNQFADYPPGYLYVLWLIGKISSSPDYLLLKLPAMLADLGLAWIAGTFAARLAPASLKSRWPVRALVAAAVLFNPGVIALSAGWGQVDAVPAFFVLWSLLLLFTGLRSLQRDLSAFVLFGIAIAMKPQAGFVFPVMLYALFRRYLHRRTLSERLDGALSIALVGAPALLLWASSGLAFGLGPTALVRFYRHAASVYPVTSANAFNLWGAIAFWRNDSAGDHVMKIAGISALHLSELLLAVALVVVLRRTHRAIEQGANEALTLTISAAVVSLLAYTLLTRMHERYMFLSLACLAPLVFVRPLRLAYGALSGLFVLNLWYPFTYFNSQWRVQVNVQDFHYQPWFNWIFGGFSTDTSQKKLWSVAVTVVVFAVAWVGLRVAERSRAIGEAERRPARQDRTDLAPGPALRASLGWLRASIPSSEAVGLGSIGATPRWARLAPLGLVATACLFCLVILRGETKPAQNLNDSAFHLQMVNWAAGQIREGRVPLDGWFPNLSLGSAFFHHYQSLSEILTAYAARVFGASDQSTFLWILYLLLALWPISVYLGARLLDWERWPAAAAAAVSPLIVSAPGYGYEHGSYTFRGFGVYSQLWAMWLLPLAWGLTWRAVAHGKRYAAAAAALALTIACHFITGYLGILTVGVWVIVLATSGFFQRVGRAAVATIGGLLVAAWVLVPLVGDTKWTTQSEFYKGSFFNDSYGAEKILGWLFTGRVFDNGRFPIVTIFFFAGVIVCLARARRDVRARALLGVFTLSLLLFFGRRTWGSLIDVLPGFHDVQIHRFVIGVHLAGIILAGVGLAWSGRYAFIALQYLMTGRVVPGRYALAATAAAVPLTVLVLTPAWLERAHYDLHGGTLIRLQDASDTSDGRDLDRLVAIVKSRHDGRVYAGLRSNWGKDYTIGAVPVFAWLCDRNVDAIGFTFRTISSLSNDPEASFDETIPADYQMFNVKYVIVPAGRKPTVPAKLLAKSGRHRLYEVSTTGYFQVVDRAPALTLSRTDLYTGTRHFMQSRLAAQGVYPGVAFAGGSAPAPSFTGTSPPRGPAGTVIAQEEQPQNGEFDATIYANRPAVALLKATYDPSWTVTVDGLPAKPAMMAPSLVGVEVPTGRHVVRFRYRPYGHYPLLLAIGLLTLIGLMLYPRRDELRHRLAQYRFARGIPWTGKAREAEVGRRPRA